MSLDPIEQHIIHSAQQRGISALSQLLHYTVTRDHAMAKAAYDDYVAHITQMYREHTGTWIDLVRDQHTDVWSMPS